MKKIAIFPAAGKLGTSVWTHLSKFVDPKSLILICRNPDKIPKHLVDAGVEVRKADYDTPESLKGVFEGASYLFLVSYPSIQIDHRFNAHKLAINAALESSPGLEHIFYTSLAFGGDGKPGSRASVMQAHLKTEAWLKLLDEYRPGISFTAIREGIYTETYPMYTAFFDLNNPSETIKIPQKGSRPGIAWAKIDELGEASARIVKDYVVDNEVERYQNKVVVLSGPKDYSFNELAEILGRIAGKEVRIEEVSADEHSNIPAVIKVMGQDRGTAAAWTTSHEAVRAGETSVVNGELERLLGRKAEDVEITIRRAYQEGTWTRR